MKGVVLTLIVVIFAALGATAQTAVTFKQSLTSPDSTGRVRIRITEHGTAQSAIQSLASRPAPDKIRGYRVRIFSDNGQNARATAEQIKNKFASEFPGVSVYMNYENPYFKVRVGDCQTKEEALILKGRVSGLYKHAFVIGEDIPVEALKIRQVKEVVSPQETPQIQF